MMRLALPALILLSCKLVLSRVFTEADCIYPPSCKTALPAKNCVRQEVRDSDNCVEKCEMVCLCPSIRDCTLECNNGYMKDESGCETCKCDCGPYDMSQCLAVRGCETKPVFDKRGCPIGCQNKCGSLHPSNAAVMVPTNKLS